jgi:hypothetical protein
MNKQVNSMSLGRLWIPLLDRKYGWIALAIIAINGLLVGLFGEWRIWALESAGMTTRRVFGSWFWILKIFVFGFWVWFFMFWPSILTGLFWLIHGVRGWFGERKRETTKRKQLCALFSLQDGTGPDGVERYLHDDSAYAVRVAAFLQHHLLRCPVPLYDDQGHYRFRCTGKAAVLAQAMIRAVGRARDNELFVVMADLAELGNDLAPVVKACRVARARHHHVLVIVPWPADVPSPDNPDAATPAVAADEEPTERRGVGLPRRTRRTAKEKKALVDARQRQNSLVLSVRKSLTKQYHETFRALRRQLGRVGATVMRFNDGDPVQLVLDRLDRVRGLRSRR